MRPTGAFVVIATVLLMVAAKSAHIAFVSVGVQPAAIKEVRAPGPQFEIVDGSGRPLAVSVECFDLSISPQAMWLAHTPLRMAGRIAAVLGEPSPADLLRRMLPPSESSSEEKRARRVVEAGHAGWEALPYDGIVRVSDPQLLVFGDAAALRVDEWIHTGAVDARGHGQLRGIWLVEAGDTGRWTLEWWPEVLLSEESRRAHLPPESVRRPDLWTRKLLRDLARLIDPGAVSAEARAQLAGLDGLALRRALEKRIWAELMPCTFRIVERCVDAGRAHDLSLLLQDEAVSGWQMKLTQRLDRRHPVRPTEGASRAGAEDSDDDLWDGDPRRLRREDAFSVLGHWGVLGAGRALAQARSDRDERPHLLDWDGLEDPVQKRARALATNWRPRSGIELACATELARPRWAELLQTSHRTYSRRLRNVARDRRRRWGGRVPDYFESASDATAPPRFVSTLEAELQQALHGELEGLMLGFDPALAMGIVLEVESGDVLAVDAVHAYETGSFAPVNHRFTPGSIFKPIVMAIALDRGVVRPSESFATHVPGGLVLRHKGHVRPTIHEAEGAPEEAYVSAEQGLAQSVNAVLVQIGLRVPAPVLRDRLARLGYGAAPGVGIGPEDSGYLPALDRGGWSYLYTHASVCFGHEIAVSLWQHAAAMATVARGGGARPLRLIRAVEQGEQRWDLPLGEARRVLSRQACAQVRAMMATGAREGTGERVASPQQCPEFAYLGTKTGTTQKVETEVCLHVELEHQAVHMREGTSCSLAHRAALVGQRAHKGRRRTCYTSSMCAIGRLRGGERELLVLIVVEGPRGKAKFGADVAGPATIRVLRRAVGLDPSTAGAGAAAHEARVGHGEEGNGGVRLLDFDADTFNERELPWAGGGNR